LNTLQNNTNHAYVQFKSVESQSYTIGKHVLSEYE